jgi:murein L,D-transpeptidase YafK
MAVKFYLKMLFVISFFVRCKNSPPEVSGDRVAVAMSQKNELLRNRLHQASIDSQKLNFKLFLRAFKAEKELEIWVKSGDSDAKSKYRLLHTYPICSASGTLGTKQKEGDRQVPEGLYHIVHFNPKSRFYLSLGINYPSQSDKIRAAKRGQTYSLGSDIYIHGDCVSIGCLAITDDYIKEVYMLALWAKNAGQTQIPVHIFPTREIAKNEKMAELRSEFPNSANDWQALQKTLLFFEKNQYLPDTKLDSDGLWQIIE